MKSIRGKWIHIIDGKAQCPYCKDISLFRPFTKEEDSYYFLTKGQLKVLKSCEHYTNHFRDIGVVARFHRLGAGY